jgi:hypothetical protein
MFAMVDFSQGLVFAAVGIGYAIYLARKWSK